MTAQLLTHNDQKRGDRVSRNSSAVANQDRKFVAAAKNGDSAAFGILCRQSAGMVFNILAHGGSKYLLMQLGIGRATRKVNGMFSVENQVASIENSFRVTADTIPGLVGVLTASGDIDFCNQSRQPGPTTAVLASLRRGGDQKASVKA